MYEITVFYIPCPDESTAESISKHLLESKLIACSSIFAVKSMYMWEGKMASEGEFAILAKALPENADSIESEVKKLHPYKVPLIERTEARVNKEYLEWMGTL